LRSEYSVPMKVVCNEGPWGPVASTLIDRVVVTILDIAISKLVGGDRPYRDRGPLVLGPSATTGG
jgi:hypothetical protein